MITQRDSSVGARRGPSTRITEAQRARMLGAAALVLEEVGYGGMSVARITSRASVSRRTFYDQFEDREDCFLALFDDALARAEQVAEEASAAVAATAGKGSGWRERVRAGLHALLVLVDEEPALGSLLVVEALSGGPKVLERRALALEAVNEVIDEGRAQARAGSSLPPLTSEGVVGAVLSVIHARLVTQAARTSTNGSSRSRPWNGSLMDLLNPLMGMIVLPYLGQAVAAKELACPTPKGRRRAPARPRAPRKPAADPLQGLDMRLTYRTLLVLSAIAEYPGASNRQVAEVAGVHDQGQISKLLGRLGRLELVHNAGAGQPKGEPNAWELTRRGRKVEAALSPSSGRH